jgi:hypothetical protein
LTYYVRQVPGSGMQVWRIADDEAVQLGVTNPKEGPGSYFKAEPGEAIWSAIRRLATGWFEPEGTCPFHKLALVPGHYYPRIARPYMQKPTDGLGWNPNGRVEGSAIAVARGQLATLVRQLERICQAIHPAPDNLGTYGHDIRNLLILACAEVESHWRGVLAKNAFARDRRSTRDYVALQAVMKLDAFAVSFPDYPWLLPVRPFEHWGSGGMPTQELAWYDAYNAAKHDRESNFSRATLGHVFEAVGACAIMVVAQYGVAFGFGRDQALLTFFRFATVPSWSLSEIYVPPFDNEGEWTSTPYPFSFPQP